MVKPFRSLAAHRLSAVIHFVPGSNLLYMNNAKVACTNVKWSLIDAFAPEAGAAVDNIGWVHRRAETPFAKGPGLAEALKDGNFTVFSMVRHPRRRFISAYFNKVHRARSPSGIHILESVGLDPERRHKPKAVLQGLLRLQRQDINPHVAPQVVNLFWGSVRYAKVFRLESLKRNGEALVFDDFRLPMADKSRHSTQHKVDLSLFDDEDYEMIDHLYRDDYEAFGYDRDPAAPASDEVEGRVFEPFLLDLLTHKAPLDVIKSHFGIGPIAMLRQRLNGPPRPLTYLETGAMIDVLFQNRRLAHLAPRLREAVEKSAMATEENAERLRQSLAELEVPPQEQVGG